MDYALFETQQHTALEQQFTEEARTALPLLHQVLSLRDLKLQFNLHRESGLYLVMVNGKNDIQLINLAKKFDFPRGCLVLWSPGHWMDARGFFPKFENDKPGQVCFDVRLLEGANKLSFFVKWSGFLGHFLCFRDDKGRLWWTAASKKSADGQSPFVISLRKIISHHVALSVVQELADQRLYVGGECMSPDDTLHGYVARKEAFVVTCMGKGTFGMVTPDASGMTSSLMHYWPSNEVQQYCITRGLQCDQLIVVTGHFEEIVQQYLLRDRDMMRYHQFQEALEAAQASFPHSIHVTPGNVDYLDVVGDTLEGFVFHVSHGSSAATAVKVKLPFYTWRTMFLRAELLGPVFDRRNADFTGADVAQLPLSADATAYTGKWCTTTQSRAYFANLLAYAQWLLREAPSEMCTALGFLSRDAYLQGLWAPPMHVLVADYAEQTLALATFEAVAKKTKVSICLCMGPVGSGKTTLMKRLHIPGRTMAIDCDVLLSGEETMLLGAERNALTMGTIWKALSKGLMPIVSLGGGQFAGSRYASGEWLRELFNKCFPAYDLQLLLFVLQPPASYQVADVCKHRYTSKNDQKKIYMQPAQVNKINLGNENWVRLAEHQANKVIQVPGVETSTGAWSEELSPSIFEAVEHFVDMSTVAHGSFMQIRALVRNPKRKHYKHITLEFSPTNKLAYSDDKWYEVLRSPAATPLSVHRYALTNADKSVRLEVALLAHPPPCLPLAHITEICPKELVPKQMLEVADWLLHADHPLVLQSSNGNAISLQVEMAEDDVYELIDIFPL